MKKLLTLIITALLLIPTASTAQTTKNRQSKGTQSKLSTSTQRGDVNGDGDTNITDVALTVNHILGNSSDTFNEAAADLNGDREVNITDVVTLVDIILNGDDVPDLELSATTVVVTEESATVEIVSGSGNYELTVSNPDVVDASLDGSKVIITSKVPGTMEVEVTQTTPANAPRKAPAIHHSTVTVKDVDTGQTADINVTITEEEVLLCPDDNHPHMIDLGLSSGTLWSCCNVGADKPEGYGGYYAWGETEEKDYYDWSTYIHCDGSIETCHDLGSDIAGTQYDVAHIKWGDSWVMPSNDQEVELYNNCTYTWTIMNGVEGGLFTGPNGGTIFLPAAGHRLNNNLSFAGLQGEYWSSTQDPSYLPNACNLSNNSYNAIEGDNRPRWFGLTVRPVSVSTAPTPHLQLSTTTLYDLPVGEEYTVEILSGSGSYTVKSSDEYVAEVHVEDNIIYILANEMGEATITVTDTQSGETATIEVSFWSTPPFSLSESELNMEVGQSKIVVCLDGTGGYVESSNESVATATITDDGDVLITAVGVGTATITVTDDWSGETAAVEVTVTSGDTPQAYLSCPDNNHPHMIDLGLSSGTKWSCCNVGADKPEGYGGYYAWGETAEKSEYGVYTYAHYDWDEDNFIYIGDHIANTQFDVAHSLWQSNWRMPTQEQCEELLECMTEETTINNVNGLLIIGPNDNSIFLPFAGFRYETDLPNPGSYGGYWSDTYNDGQSAMAMHLPYSSTLEWEPREVGQSVRPVYHPHMIDLGLPSGTKWACCNVDDDHSKQSPTNYGSYYAWGETEVKDYYGEDNYEFFTGDYDCWTETWVDEDGEEYEEEFCDPIYEDIGSDIAGTDYDVAHVGWGGTWVMPSQNQIKELLENCDHEWITVDGINGRKFTSKTNGGSIFLPAAGYRWEDYLYDAGSIGYYWSSAQNPSYSNYAYELDFGSGYASWFYSYRFYGQSVRPVSR